MSVAPVRPEDHSIDGSELAAALHEPFTDWGRAQGAALHEAIHQTFERDAERLEAEATATIAARNAAKIAEGLSAALTGPLATGAGDPHTEIDRLARLIVDGEYRRRQKEQPNE